MANLYGVANAPGLPVMFGTIGSVSIACTAGATTDVANSGPIIAPSQGWFYPIIWVAGELGFTGPSVSTAVTIGVRIGAGSNFYTYNMNLSGLVLGVTNTITFAAVGPPSQVAFLAPGASLIVSCSPVTNPLNWSVVGSQFVAALYRAPDQ